MLAQPLLLAFAAISVTAFYHEANYPAALAAKRDFQLAARQTQASAVSNGGADATATACLESLLSLYSSLPTPPPEIVSWEQTASFTDVCSISIPSSLSSAFSSYETEASSWYSEHSSAINAALSECPQYSSDAASANVCSSSTGGAGGGKATTTSGGSSGTGMAATTGQTTGTVSSSGSKSSGSATHSGSSTSGATAAASSTHNAAPRETGFVAGAVAVAGFLGVIAAL